ncbi:eukaryotic translation initiation factor 5 [Coemansia sp. RSA 1813]|nr:eukaryotic translation initiation factor 5 [Coemansia sp. RSA 1646]KAJ1772635.1 eukaryotic translation initiation factor 5 [Coemansia sp. RSA 1843]KAJ2090224.1 eukaryotic translation initiation factor 5 [Coemansia sp. RSA 986]KAJ2214629.1 eukaryotic translation initiation factor 5 [Coemansia sp. RSA 487]KAJ2570709.1 eukaryotic translation initiation factor 5 [Coemansia sp. RSA 1813]
MADKVNIVRDNNDPFYRYQMPKMQGKIEGKGNGIKTVLPNIVDVARALSRPPSYPTKYFGTELGAQTKMDEKHEKYIVNGAHEVGKLQDILDGFIDRFVLCGSCKCPETDLVITRDQTIFKKCKACGKRSDVDMRHKLTTFILKNPPPKEKRSSGSDDADGSAKASAAAGAGGDMDGDLADEAAGLRISNGDDDEDDWEASIDMSAAAVARRQKELGGVFTASGENGGADENGADGDAEDPYDQLGDYIKSNPEAKDREIYAKATELGLGKKHRALVVVAQCLFEESKGIAKDIAKREMLLRSFGDSDKHQRAVIGGIERVIESNMELRLPRVPGILKALLDEEIVDEETFLEWGKKPSKRYVDKDVAKKIHKAAQPFIEWLQNAESEDDDSE